MRPNEVALTLRSLMPAKRPIFLWGPPGIGKSQIGQQAAIEAEGQFCDIRLVFHDPSDLKFPVYNQAEDVLRWVNSIFPKDPGFKGIVCLEELPQCPPLMQAACMQITLDRRCGDYVLPDGAFIVACGNRQEDRAGANRMLTPLLNRFIHIELDVSLDDWQIWASRHNIAPEIRAFLNFRPSALFTFDPSQHQRAFASPRSWEFLHDILPLTPEPVQHPVFTGTVGEGPATEFLAFLRVYRDLPDVDLILKNPDKATIPSSKLDVMYALVGALAERSKTLPNLDALATYGKRMPDEFSALMLRDTLFANSLKDGGKVKTSDKFFQGKPMSAWIAQHRDVLIENR